MNSFERSIRNKRRLEYKWLRKLRKARDMSKKYRKRKLPLSSVRKYMLKVHYLGATKSILAEAIFDCRDKILTHDKFVMKIEGRKPPKPPSPR
jgi:hypothetical protein